MNAAQSVETPASRMGVVSEMEVQPMIEQLRAENADLRKRMESIKSEYAMALSTMLVGNRMLLDMAAWGLMNVAKAYAPECQQEPLEDSEDMAQKCLVLLEVVHISRKLDEARSVTDVISYAFREEVKEHICVENEKRGIAFVELMKARGVPVEPSTGKFDGAVCAALLKDEKIFG